MKTLKNVYLERYPKLSRTVEIFEEATGQSFTWANMTKVNLAEFVELLKTRVAPNSAYLSASTLKAVLNVYNDEVYLPKDYAKILSVKRTQSVSTWLTEDEIERLVNYLPDNDVEDLVRNQFVLGCLTGARHSDYKNFSVANIVGDKLVYVSQKTKTKAELPLSPAAERIIRECEIRGDIHDFLFNRHLRRICKECRIDTWTQVFHAGQTQEDFKYKFISSHTARRSFATNVYLRCRDIFLVSKYMGHADIQMTAGYILSVGDAPEEVKQYFEKFR